MATKKSLEIAGVEYASKSDAIRALLAGGMKKSQVAEATGSHYSFVVTVERKMLFDASEEGQRLIAEKKAKKEAKAKEKADERKEIEARKAVRAKKAAANKKKKDAADKAKAAKKANHSAKVSKAAQTLNINPVILDEEVSEEDTLINEALNSEMPPEVAAQMKEDGLLED